jgi:hypothetical protein
MNAVTRFMKCPLLAFLLIAAVVGGCSRANPAAQAPVVVKPKPLPPPESWISAKSFAILPLARAELPATGGELAKSITDAWRGALQLKDPTRVVTILGGRYPAIESLRVDLTGANVVPVKKPASAASEPKPTGQMLAVRDFALFAEPMTSRKGNLNLQVTGQNVRLEVQKDKEGRSYLMMTDAKAGTFHYDSTIADMEKMMLASARESASKHAVTVRSVKLNMKNLGPRSIYVDLYVSTLVGFVPAGVRLTARVDVDDEMNARVSNLEADGDEILGPLITLFLRPSLEKYNGKTKRLMGFPNDKVKLKDVRIEVGEKVTLDAVFGR